LKKECVHHPGKYDIGSIHVTKIKFNKKLRVYGQKVGAVVENYGLNQVVPKDIIKEYKKLYIKKNASILVPNTFNNNLKGEINPKTELPDSCCGKWVSEEGECKFHKGYLKSNGAFSCCGEGPGSEGCNTT
jgi:hypothetical protein